MLLCAYYTQRAISTNNLYLKHLLFKLSNNGMILIKFCRVDIGGLIGKIVSEGTVRLSTSQGVEPLNEAVVYSDYVGNNGIEPIIAFFFSLCV